RVSVMGVPVATYCVLSDRRSGADLSWFVDRDVSRALAGVPGVGRVVRFGGVDREVHVHLDPERMQALGVSADMVSNQIRAMNLNTPGGRTELGSGEQAIRTLGSAATVRQLAATSIVLPFDRHARLDSLGTVQEGLAEQRQFAMLNGEP